MPSKAQTKAPAGPRPATFDHLKKKQPMERVVRVVLSDETARAHEEATAALETARLTGSPTAEHEESVAKARAALDAETVVLRFRSIGRKAYDALLREHPASDEQKAEAEKDATQEPPYNVDSFAPALVAASCVDPSLTVAQVSELWDDWNAAELAQLWVAALEVNTQNRVVELGKASG